MSPLVLWNGGEWVAAGGYTPPPDPDPGFVLTEQWFQENAGHR